MEKIISESAQKRIQRYADIKTKFENLTEAGTLRTAAVQHLAKTLNVSQNTIYKAIK